MNTTLCKIHSVSPESVGLGDFGKVGEHFKFIFRLESSRLAVYSNVNSLKMEYECGYFGDIRSIYIFLLMLGKDFLLNFVVMNSILTSLVCDIGSYVQRQIQRWSKQFEASKTHEIPSMTRLMQWLPAHAPKNDTTTIVHGDFRSV